MPTLRPAFNVGLLLVPLAVLTGACADGRGVFRDGGDGSGQGGAGGTGGSGGAGGGGGGDSDGPLDIRSDASDKPTDKGDAGGADEAEDVPPPPDAAKDLPGDAMALMCPSGAPSLRAAACGAGLCGNGMRDTCSVCILPDGDGGTGVDAGTTPDAPPWPDPPCPMYGEACDGMDLGGNSCMTLGFAGGTSLSCASNCVFDTTACDSCEPGAAGVKACTSRAVDTYRPSSFALAAKGDQVAMAWLGDRNEVGESRVYFARRSADLEPDGDPVCIGSTKESQYALALAASPGGWFVAYTTAAGVVVRVLATDGTPVGDGAIYAGMHTPLFAERMGSPGDVTGTDGGPLLVMAYSWPGSGLRGVLFDEGGGERFDVNITGAGVVEPQFGDAVFTGKGFLVIDRATLGVTIWPLDLDGKAGAATMPGGSSTEYGQLAWGKDGGSVTWSDFGGTAGVRWAPIDETGAVTGSTVSIGTVPEVFNVAPIVMLGAETLVMVPKYTGGTGLAGYISWQTISATGALGVRTRVSRDPGGAWDYEVARMDTGVVMGWVTADFAGGDNANDPGRVTLVRVDP